MIRMVLEFYPSPYGHEEADHGLYWQNLRAILDTLRKQGYPGLKAMYTGVRGPDCFFEVEIEAEAVEALKLDLERLPGVQEVSYGVVKISTLSPPESHEHGLRIHLPLPVQQRRPRR